MLKFMWSAWFSHIWSGGVVSARGRLRFVDVNFFDAAVNARRRLLFVDVNFLDAVVNARGRLLFVDVNFFDAMVNARRRSHLLDIIWILRRAKLTPQQSFRWTFFTHLLDIPWVLLTESSSLAFARSLSRPPLSSEVASRTSLRCRATTRLRP